MRRELGGGGCRSLPADDVIERALARVDVALLRRRSLDRALCSRALILLIPATSRRRPACSFEKRCEAVALRELEEMLA